MIKPTGLSASVWSSRTLGSPTVDSKVGSLFVNVFDKLWSVHLHSNSQLVEGCWEAPQTEEYER